VAKKVLIIGGGFAGCTMAHQFALKGGYDVTIIERAPFTGNGVRTFFYGGHPYTFGPRHFLTQKEHTFTFLNKYVPLRRCNEHEFITYVESDGQFYTYPIHVDDIPRMPEKDAIRQQLAQAKRLDGARNAKNFEEYWVSSVGRTLYDKFVNQYSKKMWRLEDNRTLDDFSWSPKGVALKEGPRAGWDTAISAFPLAADGYNAYFDIATAGARVLLKTAADAYDLPNKRIKLAGDWKTFDIIVNTISPDTVMNFAYGELPFIGRDLLKIVLPVESCFPKDVYFVYYAGSEPFTRIVEYKKFYRNQAPSTLIGVEIPSTNGRFYPLPIKSEQERARKYFADMPEGVFSIGRAGSYEYRIDIDDCIDQAMQVIAKV